MENALSADKTRMIRREMLFDMIIQCTLIQLNKYPILSIYQTFHYKDYFSLTQFVVIIFIMQTALHVLMQYVTKIVTPASPAFGNVPFVKEQSLSEIISQLQIGDIIFTKTNNSIYQIGRKFLNVQYDHVAVVINHNEVIHISPPIISKLQTKVLVQKNRQPLIFRPTLEKKQQFVTILTSFLGEKYNTQALPLMIINETKNKASTLFSKEYFQFTVQGLKYSRICTEAILYALCRVSEEISTLTQQTIEKSENYKHIGFIMTDQLVKIVKQFGQIIYKGQPTQSKTVIDYTEQLYSFLKDIFEEKSQPVINVLKQSNTFFKWGLPLTKKSFLKQFPFFGASFQTYILFHLIKTVADMIFGKKKKQMFAFTILSVLLFSYLLPEDSNLKHKMISKL